MWAGGTVIEVKCPFRKGSPSPHRRVAPMFMPQLQGQLMATGAARLHLVSWSPYGANVFSVAHDITYQQEMGEALALFVQLVRARRRERNPAALQSLEHEQVVHYSRPAGRELDAGSAELLRRLSERVRRRSIELAKAAECIARIPASECVTVVHDYQR